MAGENEMKRSWFPLDLVIALAAGFTATYALSVGLELCRALILALYLSASVSTLWTVFRILKDPYETDKTFDDYFYGDREELRRNGRE